MAWEYSEKTKQLFMDAVHGKPGTHLGEITDADGIGEHGSIACGDALRFSFRVEKHPTDPTKDVVVEAKYLTFGCTSAIAASEALCVLIETGGYTPIEALKIQNKDIVDYLDGLPDQKLHCSVLGAEALEAAVFDWARKRNVNLEKLGIDIRHEEQEEGTLICTCFNLTEPYLRRKIKELGLKTIPEITNAIKAGGACMTCHHIPGGLQDMLNEIWGDQAKAECNLPAGQTSDKGNGLSPYQFSRKVDQVVDQYIRPMLQKDGGDVEIVDIKEKMIFVRLGGACAGCAGAGQTLRLAVEKTLKDQVDPAIKIIQV